MFVWKRSFSSTTRVLQTNKQVHNYIMLNDKIDAAAQQVSKDPVSKAFVRQFEDATTYDPFDFSLAKLKLDKKLSKETHSKNTFDVAKLNPLDYYSNPDFLSDYLSSTGRILSRDVTKLSLKNQKRLAKSIKRSRSAGLLSSVHRDVSKLLHTNKT